MKFKSVPYNVGVQKARSGRSFAAQLNLTNNPDRSSLVQLYLGPFMWMDLRVLLTLSNEDAATARRPPTRTCSPSPRSDQVVAVGLRCGKANTKTPRFFGEARSGVHSRQ